MLMPNWKLSEERYDEIREEVAYFIEDYGIAEYPFSIWSLLRAMHIRLIPYEALPENLRNEVVKVWPNAITLRPGNFNVAKTVIFYNDTHPRERIRFTLAHELAHIVLEHPAEENEVYETEADIFANYLLGPAPLVLRDSINDIETIMDDFVVSRGCATVIQNRTAKRRLFGSSKYLDYEYRILDTTHLVKGGDLIQHF